MKDFTLLIQGPVLRNLIIMANYNNYLETVVSTWWYPVIDNESHLYYRENLRIVVNPLPDVRNIYNDQNRYYQFKSTYSGLREIKTKYTIKVRSDEYYSDLMPAIRKFLEDPNKILTNNVFFRKTRCLPFHPSDHLIIGKTKDLEKVYKTCITECEKNGNRLEIGVFNQIPKTIVPEQQFAINYIKMKEGRGFKLPTKLAEIDLMKELTKKHFDVINSGLLGDFFVTSRKLGKFDNNFGFILPEIDVIHTMEEL